MSSILEDLWYGNINPHETVAINNKRFKTLLKEMGTIRDELNETLSDDQRKMLVIYDEKLNEMSSISECEAFIIGVKFGIKLMIEVKMIK